MNDPLNSPGQFATGTDGVTANYAWARYKAWSPLSGGARFGSGGSAYNFPGIRLGFEGGTVAEVSSDMLLNNPLIATLTENFVTAAVGRGLVPSYTPDFRTLGIEESVAREFSRHVEARFAAWASNPLECDLAARSTIHEQAQTLYRSYLLGGEALYSIDWEAVPGARTRTKIAVLDQRQLARDWTRPSIKGSGDYQGIRFAHTGRVEGFWIRRFNPGSLINDAIPKFYVAKTPWGRTRVGLLSEVILPGQVRGLSPLAAALTPAHARNSLAEFTLAGAMLQTSFAMTIESSLPTPLAMQTIGIHGNVNEDGMVNWLKDRQDFYTGRPISLNPAVINHMAPGDKLVMNRATTPIDTYTPFDMNLVRTTAKAAGAAYESISGDYSKTSFSASKMAMHEPWQINLRRRALIVEKFYQEVFKAWIEEQLEIGDIDVPKGAPKFWKAVDAYTTVTWRGPPPVSIDPKKEAEADVLELANMLTTRTAVLGKKGLDFHVVMDELAAEQEYIKLKGLDKVTITAGAVTTQIKDMETSEEEGEEDEPPVQAPTPPSTPQRPALPPFGGH